MPAAFITRTTFFSDSGTASYYTNISTYEKTAGRRRSIPVDPSCRCSSDGQADPEFVSTKSGYRIVTDSHGLRSA